MPESFSLGRGFASLTFQRFYRDVRIRELFLAPAIGMPSAWIQLGVRPGPMTGEGMGLILLAMLLVARQHFRGQEETPSPLRRRSRGRQEPKSPQDDSYSFSGVYFD